MDYLIGSLVTIVTVVIVNRIISIQLRAHKTIPAIQYSQSHMYNLMRPYMDDGGYAWNRPKRQSMDYQDRTYTRVVMTENSAYWIKDNSLFTAAIVNGDVDSETTQPVDTMKMSNLELNKLMIIVETLREEDGNDNRNTGNKKF
jgi:hypothetical protein